MKYLASYSTLDSYVLVTCYSATAVLIQNIHAFNVSSVIANRINTLHTPLIEKVHSHNVSNRRITENNQETDVDES